MLLKLLVLRLVLVVLLKLLFLEIMTLIGLLL
jgi:hypothetical protein